MKIVAVNFKNINSLKGEHQIDFEGEDFSQNPLFAITGPTGSGKTTILDVISLALFGEIPRLGKISNRVVEEQGAVLTRNQKEAFAKVTYDCKVGRFDSIWSISTARTGNLRDYEMELTQLNPLRRLDLKKSEVPAKNEELIGLNYAQFIKSVVLAQGEFSKFLKAPKKERSELLEQITGTGIYRQLGILAYRKFSDKHKTIETAEKVLEAEREKLLLAEDKQKYEKHFKELTTALAELSKKEKLLDNQIRLHTEWKQLKKEITNQTEAIGLQQKKEEEFEAEYGQLIANHEAVQEFSAQIQDWKNQCRQLKDLKTTLSDLSKKNSKLESDKETLFKKIQDFVRREIPEEGVLSALSDFYEKVGRLQEEHRDLANQYRSQKKAFKREISELGLRHSEKHFLTTPRDWQDLVLNSESEMKQVHQYFEGDLPEDFEALLEEAKSKLQRLQEARKEQQNILDLKTDLKRSEKRIEEIENAIKKLPQAIEKLEYRVEIGDKEVENLEMRQKNQLLRAQVEDLRQHLKKGEPCALCGSTTHPYAEHFPKEEAGLELKLKEAKQALKEFRAQLSEQKAAFANGTKQSDDLTQEIKAKDDFIAKKCLRFKEDYEGLVSFEENQWEVKFESANANVELLKQFRETHKKYRQIVLRANPIFEELEEVSKKGKQCAKNISEYYEGKNLLKDYQNLQSSWKEVLQNLDFVKGQEKENQTKYGSLEGDFNVLEDKLLKQLKQKGFSEINVAQGALLPQATYQSYKETREKIKNVLTQLGADLKSKNTRQNELKEKIEAGKTLQQLEEEQSTLKEKIENETEEKEEVQRLLKNDRERILFIEKKEEQIKEEQQENRRWRLLSDLIGDAKGKTFNQFAQDLTLRHLLKLANQRLKHISGRYRLTIKPHVKDTEDNLVVADLDMGGQERAVQTLSGGETFLMSLALALALSDLASKNVQINSLFIDEGFGTLDPETLDQTLDTLERLQASSNKIIGIISHVASLKERIATQIQLERDGQGYSTLKVVSS